MPTRKPKTPPTNKPRASTTRRKPSAYGKPVAVEPAASLLDEVHRTVGHITKLGDVVAAIPKDQLTVGITKTVRNPDGTETVTIETAPNIWLRLYQQERRHLLDACRTASACGVELQPKPKERSRVDELEARRTRRLTGGSRT